MSRVQQVKSLYKLILKLHRGLPEELQIIGTNYARDEFRRHKTCSPQEADIFMKEWTNYAVSLAQQMGVKHSSTRATFGDDLPLELIENLRDEQIIQLFELMEAARAPRDVKLDRER